MITTEEIKLVAVLCKNFTDSEHFGTHLSQHHKINSIKSNMVS